METTRRTLGLLSLVLGVAAFYVLWKINTASGSAYEVGEWLGYLMVCVWLILTTLNKIGMILNQKAIKLNALALIAFVILLFVVWSYPSSGESSSWTGIDFLFALVLFGWPIVDFVDLIALDHKQD